VHLGVTGGFTDDEKDYDAHKVLMHNSGGLSLQRRDTVRSTGDILDAVLAIRSRSAGAKASVRRSRPAARFSPQRAAMARSDFKQVPENMRATLLSGSRAPKSAEEAASRSTA